MRKQYFLIYDGAAAVVVIKKQSVKLSCVCVVVALAYYFFYWSIPWLVLFGVAFHYIHTHIYMYLIFNHWHFS